jgi:hypothetical protein
MNTHQPSPLELREEIDATRRELGATVEQLAAKTDIKARLHDRVERVEDHMKRTLGRRSVQFVAIGGVAIVLLIGWTLLRRTD